MAGREEAGAMCQDTEECMIVTEESEHEGFLEIRKIEAPSSLG